MPPKIGVRDLNSRFPAPLRGVVTPLLTPLTTPTVLDLDSLAKLIEHVLDGGVTGVFPGGTTGQGPALSVDLQKALTRETCRLVRDRVPVLAGVTGPSFADCLALACAAADSGASAIVTAGPLYFAASQSELLDYIRRLAAASPLPVFLYNIPGCSHVHFDVDTVVKAASIPNVAGLKDSTGNMLDLHQLRHQLADRPDFSLLVGPEELLAEAVLLGIPGGVNGGSNLFPRLYTRLFHAASQGDLVETRRLHTCVTELSRRIYSTTGEPSSYLRGIVCAAAALGLNKEVFAAPYRPLGEPMRSQIWEFVRTSKD